jgi:hypothetical protein
MAGAEVPEGEVLLGNVSGVKKHCHKNVIRGLDFRAAGSLLVAASVYYGFEVGSTIRSVTEWSDIFSTDWCSAIWIASGCPDHNHGLDRAESPVNTRRLPGTYPHDAQLGYCRIADDSGRSTSANASIWSAYRYELYRHPNSGDYL